jgi:hypothetical protein
MANVNIGFASARDYLDRAVYPANATWQKRMTRENAVALAKALWDLRDWHRNDLPDPKPQKGDLEKQLFAACPELKLIKDLAESAKHGGKLDRDGVEVRAITGAESPGGTLTVTGPVGDRPFGSNYEGPPPCTLALDLRNGQSRKLPEVLETTLHFWREKLS